jgi:long-chain acyl-CoA synthetase
MAIRSLCLLVLFCVVIEGSAHDGIAWGASRAGRTVLRAAEDSSRPCPQRLALRGGGIPAPFSLLPCFNAGADTEEDPPMTVEVVDAPEVPGEGKPRRHARFPDLLGHPFDDKPGIDTPLLAFYAAEERFPENKCFGKRYPSADGKGLGPYEWLTYSVVRKNAHSVGEHLVKTCGLARGSRVGIYSMNRPEWTTSALALWSQGLVCVPLYDSVGSDAVRYIVNHASLPLVFCERSKLPTLLEAAKDSRSLKHIVLLEDGVTEEDTALLHQVLGSRDLKLHAWANFVKSAPSGSSTPPKSGANCPQKADEIAVVLYTSGTTGDPKGVMLSAGNIMASASGCLRADSTYDGIDTASSRFFHEATYISYLPLAHSFELNMQMLMLMCGSAIGFFQGDARKLVTEDIPALQPTVMAGPKL